MGPRLAPVIFLSLAFALAGPLPAVAAEIADLVSVVKRDKILASFRMIDAFSEDIERAISSGLPVSFRYTVELKKVRSIWFNKRVARRQILTTVVYDNLTQRYRLSRNIDGELDVTEVVSDPLVMRRFMTELESLELFDISLLAPNEEYYLRVKGVTKDRNLFLFIPWDIGSGWKNADFTYLP